MSFRENYLDETPVEMTFTRGELRAAGALVCKLDQMGATAVVASVLPAEISVQLAKFYQKIGVQIVQFGEVPDEERDELLNGFAVQRAEQEQALATLRDES